MVPMTEHSRCPARFVEENGRWYKCVLNDDAHTSHTAFLHGKTRDADIRWEARVVSGLRNTAYTQLSKP